MQLGELQSQVNRFARRGVHIVALSVDAPSDSLAMIERLGLTFALGSDPQQHVVKAFGVQNPDTRELALHAVYIVDRERRIFYRKVGSRRPTSDELIDAVDAYRGVYPQNDGREPDPERINVAWPRNNYQALLEMAAAAVLPASVPQAELQRVQALTGDDALIALRDLVRRLVADGTGEAALLQAVGWLVRQTFFAGQPQALIAGQPQALELGGQLAAQLARVRRLDADYEAATGDAAQDELLHRRARARAGLARIRAEVDSHAEAWRLRHAKTTLRGYREVVHAAVRARDAGPVPPVAVSRAAAAGR